MAGKETLANRAINRKVGTPLKDTNSTPNSKKSGAGVAIEIAKLSTYKISVRVFHPNKNFEKMGFRFHGDNRGFSLGDSWFKFAGAGEAPTSRIWQTYKINLAEPSTQETNNRTESNFSGPGSWFWRLFSFNGENYDDPKYKPKGRVGLTEGDGKNPYIKSMTAVSHFGGENHAFLFSETMQDISGTTVVPTLDAFHEVFLRVDRIHKYVDILSLCWGDGFPNCEGFIQDAAGKKIFLGTHVRLGYPSTHLWVENDRIIWGNTIRVEIDKEGNFGDKLWVFAQVLSGPQSLRDDFPIVAIKEVCRKWVAKPATLPGIFIWNCESPESISTHTGDGFKPIHISPNVAVSHLKRELEARWSVGPAFKTTTDDWNAYHRHRDPNDGRDKEDADYEVPSDKWQRTSEKPK